MNQQYAPIEIADINIALERLGHSALFDKQTANACLQAANLLKTLRQIVLSHEPDTDIVQELRGLLAKQGEG